MNKNQMTLNSTRHDAIKRFALIAMALIMCAAMAIAPSISFVYATDALEGLMGTVVGLVTDAAFYIGLVIIIWGVFQIVLAFRREDSEGISKQITTVVVGGVLLGFGEIAQGLIDDAG